MSGYRRFVAYVYEYQKGKKGSNCGFIKVEVRDQRCSMELHLHCPGLTPQVECRIFGFVRKDGLMNGILLGSCETEEDTAECLIETDSLNMGGSGVSLRKMGGIVLATNLGGFFGTEWDDQPIRPENFREITVPAEPKSQRTVRESEESDKKDSAEQEANPAVEEVERPVQTDLGEEERSAQTDLEEEERPAQIDLEEEERPAQSDLEAEETSAQPDLEAEESRRDILESDIELEEEEFSGREDGAVSEELTKAVQDESHMGMDSEPETKVGNAAAAEDYVEPEKNEMPPRTEQSIVPRTEQSMPPRTEQSMPPRTEQNIAPRPGHSVTQRTAQSTMPRTNGGGNSGAMRKRVSFGEPFTPFSDGELVRCWKIQPQDFAYFPRRECALRNNRFLLYGYYNFGHLLLGKKPNGQYILGVPGGYDQQERFMANMFGFPYFKESHLIELPKARGGYWYRLINAPDFH